MIWDSTFVLIAHPANERVGASYSNHSEKVSTKHDSSLPTKHEPNSSMDLNDAEGTKQRRYFGKDGRAVEDIDYRHSNGDNSHVFPHRHSWDWSSGKADRSRHEKKIKEQDNLCGMN